MPKKKIGEFNGRPIVVGDHNIVTENEILYVPINGFIALFERKENGDLTPITVGYSDGPSFGESRPREEDMVDEMTSEL